ncbi:MAG: recombinase RecA [Planctomycetes bacterium]|nr:recombinase RecA [Planctomycetota bacterium]
MNREEPPLRLATGVPGLDARLGGGLIPGTLTVVVGATGIGKTQLGLQFAGAVQPPEPHGPVLDMSSRGDSQAHASYANRLWGRSLDAADDRPVDPAEFHRAWRPGGYLRAFDYSGRRVTRNDMEFEAWQQWQEEINRKLDRAIAFLYGNFCRGARRAVVDGIEPVDRPSDSIQFYLFDYLYHQVFRKDAEWVARDLFRQHYRRCAEEAARHAYDPDAVGCMLLVTSHETMLDDLIERPLTDGDPLSNANTLILMGKSRDDGRMRRALHIAKHRGSVCDDGLIPYRVTDQGVALE